MRRDEFGVLFGLSGGAEDMMPEKEVTAVIAVRGVVCAQHTAFAMGTKLYRMSRQSQGLSHLSSVVARACFESWRCMRTHASGFSESRN
jgi:hypothetical protein